MRHRRTGEPAYGGAVAKDHDLAAVLDHLIPASVDFGHEKPHPCKPLDIPRLATDHSALHYGFGCEEIIEPDIWREGELRTSRQFSNRFGGLFFSCPDEDPCQNHSNQSNDRHSCAADEKLENAGIKFEVLKIPKIGTTAGQE